MSGVSIAFLRGVNVGGHGKLPMAELREILAGLGARDVQTYIQSGNAVFRGPLNGDAISDAVARKCGFRPACFVLSRDDLAEAIARNPFPVAEAAPKTLHLFLLESDPAIDPAALDAARTPAENWHLAGRRFYLHSPEGLSRSKLAQGLDRRLGTAATGRNWATVTRMRDMADALERA